MLEAIARLEAPDMAARWLFGYSIGGRIALTLLHQAPTHWTGILLMAPDGLKKSPFYRLTVHTKLGRWAWFFIDRNAEKVKRWNDQLLRLGLISKHLHAFSEFHTVNHEMRMMVWNGWRAHRLCWPTYDQLETACQSSCRIDLVFGERDKIIPPSNALKLKARTRNLPHIQFHLVPSGHGMLKEEVLIEAFRRIFPS
jgi:pimeloyl-ACP methyl ester carboxylesterase